MTYNYNQDSLNAYYKSEYGSIVKGTCSMVAGTSIAEYYTRNNYATTLKKSQFGKIFCSLVLLGYGTGIYDGTTTRSSKVYKVIDAYYKIYNRYGYGKYASSNVAAKIESYNRNKKPVIGHFKAPNGEGHAMVIMGYYEVTIEYKKKKNSATQTEKIRYYAVNDGWNLCYSGDARVSYIRDSYLKNGITIFR